MHEVGQIISSFSFFPSLLLFLLMVHLVKSDSALFIFNDLLIYCNISYK